MGCNRLSTPEDKEAAQRAKEDGISFDRARDLIRAERSEMYAKCWEAMSPPKHDSLSAARAGTAAHEVLKAAERSSGPMGGGWMCLSIDQTLGGTGRPDQVYINPESKRIFVQDLYTGTKQDVSTASGPESRSHYQKGWSYSNEPALAALISQGYRYDYGVLNSNLVH